MDSPANAELLPQMSVHFMLSGCLQKTAMLRRWLSQINHGTKDGKTSILSTLPTASTVAQELWDQMSIICKPSKQKHTHAKIDLIGKDTDNGLFYYPILFSKTYVWKKHLEQWFSKWITTPLRV